MKIKITLLKGSVFFITLLLIISSCTKEEGPDYKYFVSGELAATYTKTSISGTIGYIGLIYPELADMGSYVTDGVKVYKMVYKTTINGEEIEASGLVCVPETTGDYPVLSFQNGTNTQNSNSPTEKDNDNFYQLVEYISSMGFVVVIPDYPGFGSSFRIPHPYLISEPTVQSITDMYRALNEGGESEFTGINVKNEYYLIGYSQGGWATLSLHKALELDYAGEFNLIGSVCGAGPYNMYNLFLGMINTPTYPMPSYLGYIINAYSSYNQFTNPVSDILNEPYASRLGSLYTGVLSLDQINDQLTTSMTGLMKSQFLAGFASSPSYSTVREALIDNSISAWNASKPLYLIHSDGDTHVSVTATQLMYNEMTGAGTSTEICKQLILTGLDHGDAVVPFMAEGISFILNLRDQ
jgi:pimeloyl-ACP methyl ester carboxylesterase